MNSSRIVGRGRIARLVLERIDHEDESELRLELVLVAEPEQAARIRFDGVKDLRFRGATTELTELVVLLATDLSERQWENIAYRVVDAEEEVLSFLCARIAPAAGTGSENHVPAEA